MKTLLCFLLLILGALGNKPSRRGHIFTDIITKNPDGALVSKDFAYRIWLTLWIEVGKDMFSLMIVSIH